MMLKIAFLYVYAFFIGLSWTTVPALSTLLTSSACENLGSALYGSLMMALVFCAILSSISSATILLQFGMRRLLLTSVLLAISSSVLLFSSHYFIHMPFVDYLLLLSSQCLLGLCIGMGLTALNVYIETLITTYKASFLVALYACMGLGSTYAPIHFENIDLSCEWHYKVLLLWAVYIFLFFVFLWFLPVIQSRSKLFKWVKIKDFRFWIFAMIPFFYGLIEESITVWGPISLYREGGWSQEISDRGLTYFWGSITFFQVLISLLCFKVSSKWIYYVLSLIIAFSFYFFSCGSYFVNMPWIFALAGMGCSAFYSLTVHFGEKKFPNIIETISGTFVCSYMIGGGISAVGIGVFKQYWGLRFSEIYIALIFVAFLMFIGSLYLLKEKKSEN